MRTVLVTGGIGSGKSAVCRILERNGVPVYDSDSRTKALYVKDRSLLDSIVSAFGAGMILADGTLDRKALASVVFADSRKLAELESLVHPRVIEDFVQWRREQHAPVVAFESAIAMRLPSFMELMDSILLVEAEIATRVLRAAERDGAAAEAVMERASAQNFENNTGLPLYRIDNNGTPAELESSVLEWIDKFKN